MLVSLFVNGADFALLFRSLVKSIPIWLHPGFRLLADLVPIGLITGATVIFDMESSCPYNGCPEDQRLLGFWILIVNSLV